MKRITSIFTLVLLMAVLSMNVFVCRAESHDYGIEAADGTITRTYDVSKGFSAITSDIVGNIVFTQSKDGKSSLKITGPEDYIDKVIVEVKSGVLILNNIKLKKNSYKGAKILIAISSPVLESINLNGVGNFAVNEPLNCDDLNIKTGGVGNVVIENLNCKKVNIINDSVGNITISGVGQEMVIKSAGVGSVYAQEFKAVDVVAICSGVGHINCYASASIKATVSGIGNIRYKGKPTNCDIDKSGIGNIKPY